MKKKNKQCEVKEPTKPCKVTAKKGTLTHLKQRQKRQEYLLQQQQEDEPFDDFFDDTDNPQIGNFHTAKYQISDLLLNSSSTSDSTAFPCFNISLSSISQTPPTTKNARKNNIKKQIGNDNTSTGSSKHKKESCKDGTGISPRSALLARFAGDESAGRGLPLNTSTPSGKKVDLGVNLGLAMSPGELLEQSIAYRIIYNNKMKRPRKRLVFTSPTPPDQSSLDCSSSYWATSQSGARKLRNSFSGGSLGQSSDTSLQKQSCGLPEVAVEYEFSPAARAKKLKRLKLPSIADDLESQEDEGCNHDDYFEDGDS